MAYRRKSSKRKSTAGRRRRRVSGIGNKSTMLTIAAAAGGYFLGDKINSAIKEKLVNADGTPKVDPKIIAAAEVLAGFLVPKYAIKGTPGKLVGGFLIGMGAHEGLRELGVVSGFSDLKMIAGPRDMKMLAGIEHNTAHRQTAPLSSLQVISGITTD